MYRTVPIRSLWVAVLAAAFLSYTPLWADEENVDKKPAVVIVRLPAEAELTIAGVKSKQKTPVREFDTPPLPLGKKFSYPVRAVWKDGEKEVKCEKTIIVRAGETTEVDLLKPMPLPLVAEKITAPEVMPEMEDKPAPEKKPEPMPEMKPEAEKKPEPMPETKPEAEKKPEPKAEAEKKPEPKPEPPLESRKPPQEPPTPPGTLTLHMPDTLTLAPGGSKLLPIKIVRRHCDGPVHISFEGVPSGVSLKEATVAADKQKVYVHVRATGEAELKETEIKTIGVSGSVRQESALKIRIAK